MTTPIADQRAAKMLAVRSALGESLPAGELTFTDGSGSGSGSGTERPPRHDRLRVLYPVQPDATGQVTMGLFRRGTHQTIEIESCELQHPSLTELARRALRIFRARRLLPYDEVAHRGLLRAFSARLSVSTGELLIGLVTTSESLPDERGLARELIAAATGLGVARGKTAHAVGVIRNVNAERGNQLVGGSTTTLQGRDHIFDKVDGLTFRISFGSFYQLHRRAHQLLYRPALQMIEPWLDGARVLDGYGGVATFALRCGRRGARSVTLIENGAAACADARFNAQRNAVPLTVVEAAVCSATLPEATPTSPDLLILDPSRAGLRPAGCEFVRRLAPPRILYVACGLPALARDLAELPDYRVTEARLADLFPHTPHIEVLAVLAR